MIISWYHCLLALKSNLAEGSTFVLQNFIFQLLTSVWQVLILYSILKDAMVQV